MSENHLPEASSFTVVQDDHLVWTRYEQITDLRLDTGQLGDLLDERRSWSSVAAEIPRDATVLLWMLTFWDVVVTVWLVSVERGSLPCSGRLCSVMTLGGHPVPTLSLAVGSLVWLAVTSVLTRGFRRGTAPLLLAVSANAALATLAVIGTVLVAVLVAAVIALPVVLMVAVAGGRVGSATS